MVFSSVAESVAPGVAYEGETVDPDTAPGVTTVEGVTDSTAGPETAPGAQQSPLVRLKTRLETRPKKPQGLNRPVPSPQWLKGPD
jgi:hypothetical protein